MGHPDDPTTGDERARPGDDHTLPELPTPPDIPELLLRPTPRADPRVGQPQPVRPDMMGQWGRVFVIGTNFAAAVIGFSLIGYVLDRWLKTSPLFLLIGVGMGLVGGFVGFLREARRLNPKPPAR
ncbi:MAG: AtpZ/AtpI family protein [Phycisphaerae bacterium]|nr:AtpZ/AtpI family protein [Phycisphaerae bacterium]